MTNLLALADNALKLARDARLLFDHGRYETCLSLSILSIEETGKYLMLSSRGKHEGTNRATRIHSKKQQRAALSITTRHVVRAIKAVKKIDHIEQMLDPTFEMSGDDSRMVQELLLYIGAFEAREAARSGHLDRLKHAGFYIDLGSPRPDPGEFEEQATRWLEQAEALAEGAVRAARDPSNSRTPTN